MGFSDIINDLNNQGNGPGNPMLQPSPNDTPRIAALKKQMLERQAQNAEAKRLNDSQQQIVQGARNYAVPKPQVETAEQYASGTLGNEQEVMAQRQGASIAGTAMAENVAIDKNNQANEFGVDRVYMDFATKASENYMVGLGNMIGDYGDISQMVGAALGINTLAEGNFLSRALQETGKELTEENATYIPPELQDPNFSISTLINPDFWLIHGAQFAPQIMEILATMGAGAAVKRGVAYGLEKGLTKYFAKEIAETAVEKGALEAGKGLAMEAGEQAVRNVGEAAAKRGLVGTTVNTTANGAGAIEELTQGAKGLGKLLRDTGRLSNAGDAVAGAAGNIAGGVLTNLRVSISNAGEVYNTYANMKNPDGTAMFTQEELAQMASSTFFNNMNYMMMDILSWSMTYGGGRSLLSNATSKLKTTLTEAAQRKVSGALLSKSISPAMKKGLEYAISNGVKFANKSAPFARWATVGAMEGLEESIQEVHEEWSKMKGYLDGAGSLVNYQGKGKQHAESFWDFYTSKEMEGTRTIASFLGAAAGGVFNIKELVNKAAEDAHQMNTRAELLKGVIKAGTARHEMQQYQLESAIREQVFQGKEAYSEGFINDMVKKGIIDEERANTLSSLVDEAIENREKTNLLNMNGKHAYYTSLMQEKTFTSLIEDAEDKYKIRLGELDQQFDYLSPEEKEVDPAYNAAKKALTDTHEATVGSLQEQIDIAQENKRNLLTGKPAKPIKLNSGEYNGNIFYYNAGDTDEDSLQSNPDDDSEERKFSDDDPEVNRAKRRFKKGAEELLNQGKKIVDKAKNALKKLSNSFNTDEDGNALNPDENGNPVEVAPADYKKPKKPASEMNEDDIAERVQEIEDEKNRLESEMEGISPEERGAYNSALQSLNEETDQLGSRMDDLDSQNTDQNQEPEKQPEEDDSPKTYTDPEKSQAEPNQNGVTDDDLEEYLNQQNNPAAEPRSRNSPSAPSNNDAGIESQIEEINKKRQQELDANPVYYAPLWDNQNRSQQEIREQQERVKRYEEGEAKHREINQKYDNQIEELRNQNRDNNNGFDEDDIISGLTDFRERRPSRKNRRKRGNTTIKNGDENIDPEQSTENKLSEAASSALTGAKKGLNNLLDKGRSFGNRMMKNRGNNGKLKYYQQMILESERFGHQFITRMNEVNNSGLWNGVERPNLYFVHNMNVLNSKIDPETPGIYIPAANSIFMKQNAWDDDLTYHHEFLHFNYAYMADTSEMKDYLQAIYKNYPQLVDKIKEDYWDQILVSMPGRVPTGSVEGNEALYADPLVMKKGQIFDLYPNMSEDEYSRMIKSGELTELPLEDQLIINEEIFAHSQEGPRSEKYNFFFEEKPPKNERKTFWQRMKARFDKVFPTQQEKENTVLDALIVPNMANFTDITSALWNDFDQRFPKGTFEQGFRERRINNLKEQYAGEAEQIVSDIQKLSVAGAAENIAINNDEERIQDEQITYSDEENINPTSGNMESDRELPSDDLENLSTDVIADSYFDSARNASETAITKIINGTIDSINRRLNNIQAQKIAENNGQYVAPIVFDAAALEQEMFERAKDSEDVTDFILQMRKSESPEIKLMLKSLAKGQGQNSEVSVLKAYYQINKNKHALSPVVLTINPEGNLSVVDAKTSLMNSKINQVAQEVEKRGNQRNSYGYQQFDQYVADMEHIRKTPEADIDMEAVVRVLQYFGDKSVDYDRILDHGYLTIKGQDYSIIPTLKSIANASVKGKYTYDSRTKRIVPFNPATMDINHSTNTKYDVYGTRPRIDDIVRGPQSNDPRAKSAKQMPLNKLYGGIINSVFTTDSKFKNSKSYRNAEGNLTGARMANNSVLSIFEKMSNDILTNLDKKNPYSKQKFMANYANISKDQTGTGKLSNVLLSHIYDTVLKTGLPYQVVPSFGIRNEGTGNGKILKNQNPDEESLDQLAMYDQRKRFKNYFMDLGRFSSSSQRFLINVPIQENLYGADRKIRKSPQTVNAFNIFKNQTNNPDLTFEKFSSDLASMLNSEFNYWEGYRAQIRPEIRESISMLKSGDLSKINPLSEAQKNDIADYFYNQFLNGLYSNEVIFPGFKFNNNDLIKRSASGSTTFTPLGNNVGHEIIYFHDGSEGDVATDGAAYVLKEDLDRIKNTAGKFMPINGHIKMAHVGVEYDGPEGMNGVTQYDKPLYIGIDENYVKQNPALKGLYDLMVTRKAKWSEQNGTGSADYADGTNNHLVTAVSMSAEKSKNRTKAGWAIDLADINEGTMAEQNEKLDKIYYAKDNFKGFSGNNVGVQIVMNNNVNTSVVPSQLISFITTGGNNLGDMGDLKEAQQYIFDEMQENLSQLENAISSGSVAEITEFIKNKGFFDQDKMDQISKMLLFDENLNVAIPQVRELVMNSLKQYIIKNGNRLSTPGTQARVTPSFGYTKKFNIDGINYEIEELHDSYGETKEGEYLPTYATYGAGLQDYKKTYQKVNNQWVENYQPAEMVAPASLAKQGVRKRQYFVAWDGNTSENSAAYKKAVKFAKQNGMTENDLKRFRVKGRTQEEGSFGFYIPGETVMATRIPSHGPQSTGFFEVVDFEVSGTSQVQVPAKFTSVTGQDHDGDALFINIKDKKNGNSNWNKAFDKLQDHWLSPAMQQEVNQELSFQAEADQAIEYLKSKIPNIEKSNTFRSTEYLHAPEGRRNQFRNTLISKGNIGSVMSLHRTYSILSNYDVEFQNPIVIGNKYSIDGFSDFMNNEAGTSRTILSANIANMILDDVKNGLSSKLGINSNTIKYVMPLVNMGVDLGDIAVIMNSDVMQQWNQMNEFNDNIFANDEYLNPDILSNQNKMKLLGKENASRTSGNIDFDNINSMESKVGIMKLISELSAIQNDMHKLGTIIRGHNQMETNAFIGQQELNNFDNFLQNRTQTKNGFVDNFLVVNDDFRTSPLIQNYRKNAELMVNLGEKTDIVFSDKGKAVWNTAVTNNPRNINDEKQRAFHNNAVKFTIAQYLGLAGQDVKQHMIDLTAEGSPKNIFTSLAEYMAKPINPEETTNPNRKTYGTSNVLFQHALITNLHGKNSMKYIRLNGVIADEDTSPTMRDIAKQEFSNLPTYLQRDLVLYDLMKNGFNGKNSLFPLFSPEIKDQIQQALNDALYDKSNQQMDSKAHGEMLNNFLGNNSDAYLVKTTNMLLNTGGNIRINPYGINQNREAWNAIQNSVNNGSVVYFSDVYKANEASPETNKKVYRINPFTPADIDNFNQISTGAKTLADFGLENTQGTNDADFFLSSKLQGKISEVNFDSQNPEVSQIITSNAKKPRIGLFDDLQTRERRIRTENYYKYERKLNRGEFDKVMEYPVNMNEDQKARLYSEYEADLIEGEKKNNSISDQKLRDMTDEQLQNLYAGNENATDRTKRGVGYQNKFAYSKIINRVTREIANRAAAEQANLIRKNNPGINYEVPAQSKDLGVMQSWLVTSNIPSDQPALQAAIRKIKAEEKIFKNEKSKYMQRLNKVTADLYMEKLGFNPYAGLKGKAKFVINQVRNFFRQGEAMKALYGNLIKEEIIQREDGSTIKNMRYHDPEVMQQKLKSGEISQAEYNFYKETSAMMKEFEPYVVKSNRGGREGYIPHVAPSMMEAYSRKGLLGVMANLKDVDEQLSDVKLNFNGKLTPYNEVLGSFIAQYNGPGYNPSQSGKQAVELYKLKTKAIKLLQKGINEDGSPIQYSDVQIGSTLGDVFMNEFSGERGVKASDLPSWDLNKAFSDYFHGALFNAGNGNFGGFKSMLPLFDGIIANAYKGNQPNTVNYVDKVWRQYFLQGAKQHHTKTPAHLKAVGVTTDGVIDFLTKGSLFYWLGYKGLAVGGGMYALGNVLAGKFNNIKDQGGKSWLQGEQRFWKGTEPFDIKNPFKGVKQSVAIMKKAGFMDINIYDDVSLSEGGSFGSFLGDVALMPMVWSEKWIQGVQFLGQLTDEEYNRLATEDGYTVPEWRMNELESNVTLSQGRGYQPTDQRMIQMYSYGRMAMQFSRWIPTTLYNLFGKEDFDIYGRKFIGQYRAFGKMISRFTSGEISPAQFVEYRKSLSAEERRKLDGALAGFGLMTLAAGGMAVGFQPAEKLFWDMNVYADVDRLSSKAVPPAVSMVGNLTGMY